MSYKEIIDNVSNIEDLDNVTILKVLEKFSKTIKDFAIEQSGLNNLVNVEFIPSDNNTTYTGDSVDYLGTLKLTLSDNIIVNKSCNIKFNIKSSNTIVVNVDEFNNSLELHLDNSVVTTLAFAESERQKSKNLFDYTKIKSLNYGITQADGIFTINTRFYYPLIAYDIKLNQGETYTFSLNIDSYSNSDGSGVNSEIVLFSADGNTDTKGVGGVNSIGRYSMTFTPTFDVVSIEIRPIRKGNNTSTLTGTVSNLMLCVGEDRDYQPYNGAIVHEKQIADVEHIDVLYDKTSSDANINKGLTSGIPFDNTTELNLGANLSSKYKGTYVYITIWNVQLRIYCDITYSQEIYSFLGYDINKAEQSLVMGCVSIAKSTGILKGTKLISGNVGGSSYSSITDGKYNIYKVEGVK